MKAIRHSHHEQFLRLCNDDAALLVSSGRWVYTSKFEARKASQRPPRRRSWLIGAALAFTALAVLLWAGAAHAADKPVPFRVCLTQAQAAKVYPGKHLKYRLVKDEHGRQEACYYAGATLPKHAFIISRAGAKQTLAPSTKPFASQGSAAQVLNREFNSLDGSQLPRPAVATANPLAQSTQDAPRVQGQASQELGAGATAFTATLVEDAFKALTGVPESYFTFDAMWSRALRDAAGTR